MKPKSRGPEQDDLLRPRLTDPIDMRHELARFEALIDWEFFETEWSGFFPSHTGRPANSPRLVKPLTRCVVDQVATTASSPLCPGVKT
jgi:IS5 family transposase